jgi:MFS family permease
MSLGAALTRHRLTFGLFLSALETTIVSTTLDTIAKHFDDEREYSWIVTAYMVTFNGK